MFSKNLCVLILELIESALWSSSYMILQVIVTGRCLRESLSLNKIFWIHLAVKSFYSE